MPTVESPADFDRYVAERNIPEEEWPELSLAGSPSAPAAPVPGFEKVELRLRGRARLVADRAWAGTCRQLMIAIDDGTYHFASFRLTK